MVSANGKSYTYDGFNRRIKQEKTDGSTEYSMYSQSGKLLYRETADGGINYIFLGRKLVAKEGVGVKTPVEENDETSIVNSKPFGENIETTRDSVGYTGHKFDQDIGLNYMQARYYDPVIGRFYSNDPVGFTGDITTFNRYSYVGNNPYKYTDPNGQNRLLVMGARLAKNPTRAPKMISRAVRSFAEGLSILSPVLNENTGGDVGSGVNPDVPDGTDQESSTKGESKPKGKIIDTTGALEKPKETQASTQDNSHADSQLYNDLGSVGPNPERGPQPVKPQTTGGKIVEGVRAVIRIFTGTD